MCAGNVKYIYANNEQEAKEKYKKYFFKEYKRITYGHSNWYSVSEGVDFMINENRIDIISTEIVFINNECYENYEYLKENMSSNDLLITAGAGPVYRIGELLLEENK